MEQGDRFADAAGPILRHPERQHPAILDLSPPVGSRPSNGCHRHQSKACRRGGRCSGGVFACSPITTKGPRAFRRGGSACPGPPATEAGEQCNKHRRACAPPGRPDRGFPPETLLRPLEHRLRCGPMDQVATAVNLDPEIRIVIQRTVAALCVEVIGLRFPIR